ncbi:MAG: cyclodeaminase/cyclohydrolase family protein, partial [Actinobacteria bacterium]|nr:cyclodeaminase/cyclohydrolase family protein [Actinomycetota bacterium]
MLALRLDAFLEALAAPEPVPSAGGAAAVCAAMAGSLVAMAARVSPAWEDGAGVAAQAQALRARVTPLALADSEAYAE